MTAFQRVLGVALASVSVGLSACVDPSTPDASEPNDTTTTATHLGTLSDVGSGAHRVLTLHDATDEDWFAFTVLDEGIDGNPEIEVWLETHDDAPPLSIDFTFTCIDSEGGHAETVSGVSPVLYFTTDCTGNGDVDSGVIEVGVKHAPGATAAVAYELHVFVD